MEGPRESSSGSVAQAGPKVCVLCDQVIPVFSVSASFSVHLG